MKQYIPHKIDLDKLIEEYPVEGHIKNFKKDNLIHIISLLTELPASAERYDEDEGFVQLNAGKLQSRIHNYREYLDYLLASKVIETDNHYVVNLKSRGYRFTPTFNSEITAKQISDWPLIKHIMKDKEIDPDLKKHHNYVIKWWDEDLYINYEPAMDMLKKEKTLNITTQVKNPYGKYNCTYYNINRFNDKDFFLSIDNNIGRFHSNLTNMKSEYRNYIQYNGENLVSVDIQNSTPYLSTVLFNTEFYDSTQPSTTDHAFNIHSIYTTPTHHYTLPFTHVPPPMLVKTPETPMNSDFQLFSNLVENGQLYEYLQDIFKDELGIEYEDRKAVKEAVFTILFTGNQFIGQEEAKPKQVFKKHFPTVYELFAYLKKNDKKFLSNLLQRIESHLILNVICKRIAKEYPKLPIFTIHDSIATTSGNEKIVESIMKEELTKHIGIPPSLKFDYWFPPNLN